MPPLPGPSRRTFLLGTLQAGGVLAGLGGLFRPAVASELQRAQKRAILVWMGGGPSQLETWDPKPGRPTAGPHGTIATSVSGVRFDEYMPRLARLADRMAVVRSVTSKSVEHGEATAAGLTCQPPGRSPAPPAWLAVCAHELVGDAAVWPAFVSLGQPTVLGYTTPPGGGFLGPRYDPLPCPGDGKPPDGLPAADADLAAARRRDALRDRLATDFRYGHDEARLAGHDAAFRQLDGLLDRRGLFDLSREPVKRATQYGNTKIGRDCLLACRLVERGVPFVLVAAQGMDWDLHGFGKTTQRDVTVPFDTAVGALIDDLIARGLWEHTLVVLMGEFGRSPSGSSGRRDHWAKCWSMSFGGAGVKPAVIGSTNEDGRDIKDRPVTLPDLLVTFCAALGIDPRKDLDVQGRPTPFVERDLGRPVREVL